MIKPSKSKREGNKNSLKVREETEVMMLLEGITSMTMKWKKKIMMRMMKRKTTMKMRRMMMSMVKMVNHIKSILE
jgi:hypothetical protein